MKRDYSKIQHPSWHGPDCPPVVDLFLSTGIIFPYTMYSIPKSLYETNVILMYDKKSRIVYTQLYITHFGPGVRHRQVLHSVYHPWSLKMSTRFIANTMNTLQCTVPGPFGRHGAAAVPLAMLELGHAPAHVRTLFPQMEGILVWERTPCKKAVLQSIAQV